MRVVPRAASASQSERMTLRAEAGTPMVAPALRLAESIDFERVLRRPACARSTQFALHHVSAEPALGGARKKLLTGNAKVVDKPVDDLVLDAAAAVQSHAHTEAMRPTCQWWGWVVPKRHARRAVTRQLVKRHIRHAVSLYASALPAGLWVVRLSAPIRPALFPSAASKALADHLTTELSLLMARATSHGLTGVEQDLTGKKAIAHG